MSYTKRVMCAVLCALLAWLYVVLCIFLFGPVVQFLNQFLIRNCAWVNVLMIRAGVAGVSFLVALVVILPIGYILGSRGFLVGVGIPLLGVLEIKLLDPSEPFLLAMVLPECLIMCCACGLVCWFDQMLRKRLRWIGGTAVQNKQ